MLHFRFTRARILIVLALLLVATALGYGVLRLVLAPEVSPNFDRISEIAAPVRTEGGAKLEGWLYAASTSFGGAGGSNPEEFHTVSLAWGDEEEPFGSIFLVTNKTLLTLGNGNPRGGNAAETARSVSALLSQGMRVELEYELSDSQSGPEEWPVAISIRTKHGGLFR